MRTQKAKPRSSPSTGDRIDWAFSNALRAAAFGPPRVGLDPLTLEPVARAVLERAAHQRLSPLVFEGLSALGVPIAADEAAAAAEAALFSSTVMTHFAHRLGRDLQQAGIGYALLKGVLSDAVFFGGRGRRGATDIDLLVSPADVDALDTVLRDHGCRPVTFFEHAHAADVAHSKVWTWTKGSLTIAIDAHSVLYDDPPLHDDTHGALARAIEYSTSAGPMRGLRQCDWLVFCAANLSLDGLSGRDKLMLDAAVLADDPAVLEAAATTAQRIHIAHGLWALLALVETRFGIRVDPYVKRSLAPSALKQRLLYDIFGVDAAPLRLGGAPTRLLVPDRVGGAVRATLRWARVRGRDLRALNR